MIGKLMRPLSPLGMALPVFCSLLFLYTSPVRADWPEPLPPDAPRLDWGQVSGYFQRRQSEINFSYIEKAGFLLARKDESGEYAYYYTVGKWNVVEYIVAPPNSHHQIVLGSDEEFCSYTKNKEQFHRFRLLELVRDRNLITIDFAMDIKPSQNIFTVPTGDLWQLFKADAHSSDYKDEGYWYPIPESQAPQWFRDLVAKTVLSGRFHCDDGPPR